MRLWSCSKCVWAKKTPTRCQRGRAMLRLQNLFGFAGYGRCGYSHFLGNLIGHLKVFTDDLFSLFDGVLERWVAGGFRLVTELRKIFAVILHHGLHVGLVESFAG